MVRDIAVRNQIPLSNVGVSQSGDTFIQCPSASARDKLQPLLEADLANKVVPLKEKLPQITIVDIDKTDAANLSKESILMQVTNQNPEIARLIADNHEFTILFVKDGKSANKCIAVARVTCEIRNMIRRNRNHIYVGISSCRVLDRFFIKRCNKCQDFGHYKSDCTSDHEVCGYCGENHSSEICPLKDTSDLSQLSCHNCKKAGLEHKGHSTFWNKCPVYLSAQKKLKSTIPYYDNLNG